MRRVGIREFRDNASQFLGGDEVLVVERHGQPIGFYVPTGTSRERSFVEALERLEETVQRILADSELSEDELGDLFDLTKPVPEAPSRRRRSVFSRTHASGR